MSSTAVTWLVHATTCGKGADILRLQARMSEGISLAPRHSTTLGIP
jgi:hypothetical protein